MQQSEAMDIGSILNFERKPPRKAVQGGILLDRIFKRDFSIGGSFTECTGSQGCGKTSLLLGFAEKIIRTYPGELVLWRESIDCPAQWNKFNGEVRILVEKNYKITIRNQVDRSIAKEIEIIYFEGLDELLSLLKPSCLNVIYFEMGYSWVDLIKKLIVKPGFKTLLWDEYEDLLPEHSSGIVWKKNGEFSNALKQVRKGCISLICATQSNSDVDFRVRKKLNSWIYMYGSRPDSMSPISLNAIHSLRIGAAWIDSGHCLFGEFTFPAYEPKPIVYVVEEY